MESVLGFSMCRLGTLEGERMVIRAAVGDTGVMAEILLPATGTFTGDDMRLLELLLGHAAEALKRVSLQNELREQAIHDPLAGLYNRRYFAQMIERELEASRRCPSHLTFLLIDVNLFKEINDRFGHHSGDIVLQKVGKLLQEQLRGADTIIRYGGDEFLIILPGVRGEEEVEAVARRIRDFVARWNGDGSPVDFPVNLAIGISTWDPSGTEPVEAALHRADQRMYDDKRNQEAAR